MTKREERENTYRILFRAEFHPAAEMEEQIDSAITALTEETDPPEEAAYLPGKQALQPEDTLRIRERLLQLLGRKTEIDGKIEAASQGWNLSRIGKSELAILRLAVFEMLFDEEIPVKVAINEAVELSKRYCDEEARAFINGILGRIEEESEA